MRVAAVQLEVALADVRTNLAACESLARDAARDGAEAIALPEFFTTGAAFVPELAGAALAPDGAATQMLLRIARDEGVLVGGSFLCRDADGEVRNAFFLAGPDGLLGRHDKDLPTMWENALGDRGRRANDRRRCVLGVHAQRDGPPPAGKGRPRSRRLELVDHSALAPRRIHAAGGSGERRACGACPRSVRTLHRGADRPRRDHRQV